jgi:hypothetical protein
MQANLRSRRGAQENAVAGRTEAWEALDQIPTATPGLVPGSGKFVDGKYGNLELFDEGLDGYVGLPDVDMFKAMVQEHASTEKFTPSNKQGARPLLLTP